ncbi:MAG: hypothetical protein CSA82_00875 [Actinobacteria bacterium]|nr:MAG: hypothetical protein CSA82_00875 [Actinomycetota bacterium]
MRPLSVLHLVLLAGVGMLAAVIFTVFSVKLGSTPFLATPYLFALAFACSALLFWAGRGVRRLRDGTPTRMTPILALKVAFIARASALVSATIVGLLAGVVAVSVTRLEAPAMVSAAITDSFVAVGFLVWCVVALIVERWCVVDSDDEGETTTSSSLDPNRSRLTGGV